MRRKIYLLILNGIVNFFDVSGVEGRIACNKLIKKGPKAIVINSKGMSRSK
jgi:hypothetical protein